MQQKPTNFLEGIPENNFIVRWVKTCGLNTDTYPEYLAGGSLFALAQITQRKAKINIIPNALHTNLWIMLLGRSTLSRKTTAMDLIKKLFNQAGHYNIHPSSSSEEQYYFEFMEKPCGCLMFDEYVGTLKNLEKKYQSGLADFLCQMYGCPEKIVRTLRKEKNRIEIINAFLCLFGATTPDKFEKHCKEEDFGGGYFPRHLFIWTDYKKERRPIGKITEEYKTEFNNCVNHFKTISEFFEKQTEELEINVSESALSIQDAWMVAKQKELEEAKNDSLDSFIGRLEGYSFKLAFLIQLGNPESIQLAGSGLKMISAKSMSASLNMIDVLFLPSIKKINSQLRGNKRDKLIALIERKFKGGVKRTDLMNLSNMDKRTFDLCIDTLIESGRLEELTDEKIRKDGKRKYTETTYRIIKKGISYLKRNDGSNEKEK